MDDLVLVHAHQGPEDREGRRRVDDRHVVQGLGGDLADRLAGDEGGRAARPRDALGDAEHEAPVDDHPERRGHRQHHPALDLAESHHVEPRLELAAGQQGRDLRHLVLGRAGQDGVAVEVDESDAAAALDHPPRRHRRVDAPRQQARDPAARPAGQAPGPRLLPQAAERPVGQHLHPHRQGRPVEVDPPPLGRLDAAPQVPLDLRRRQGKPLVGAPGRHPEAVRLDPVELGEHGVRDGVEVAGGGDRPQEVGDAGHAGEPLAHLGPVAVRRVLQLEAAHQGAHPDPVDPGHRGPDVGEEPLDEPRAVASLEGDLLIVDDDRGHARSR